MRYVLTLLLCCSGLLAQSPLLDPTSWVWGGRDPDLTFEWHCESTNADYSLGDMTGTLSSAAAISDVQEYDGAYSLSVATADDRIVFDVLNDDLVDDLKGTVEFWARLTTTNNSATLWYAYGSANDFISVSVVTGGRLRIAHRGASENPNLLNTAVGNTFSPDTWFKVTGKWQKDATPYLSIAINGTTDTFSSTNLSAHTTGITNLIWGDRNGVAPDGYIDNCRIWNVVK